MATNALATRSANNVADPLAVFDPWFSSFFHEPFFGKSAMTAFKSMESFVPAMDVTESASAITLHADVPGIKREDIKISLKGSHLTVSGTKTSETTSKDEHRHVVERRSGSFSRTLRVPANTTAADVTARCADGVLTVTVAKHPEASDAEISIQE
eukprot:a3_195.p2 GENE.a3_195~~a3_195.p2  ORF type:complete len:178 (+),score=92.03 a3_195:72-536(+)